MSNFRFSQLDPLPKTGLELGKTIGQGSFAVVKAGREPKRKDKVYAIKFIHLKFSAKRGISQQAIVYEAAFHKKCASHPNILNLHHFGTDNVWFYIIMELASNGDLFDKIEPDIGVEEDIAQFYAKQLISAVDFIHKNGIAHRDIKPENILLDGEGNLKLADFGLAVLYQKGDQRRLCHEPCGSPPYMAPEIVEGEYDPVKSDIWACGVVLYVLLTGEIPWSEPTHHDKYYLDYERNDGKLSGSPWNRIDMIALSLIRSSLKVDPSKRITMANMRKHPFFTKQNPLSNDQGLCRDSNEMATKLMSNLHVGLTDSDVNKTIGEGRYHTEKPVSASQPILDLAGMLDDGDREFQRMEFPATQQESSDRYSRLSKEDEILLEKVAQDPALAQFREHSSQVVDINKFKFDLVYERLTRFFSIAPFGTVIQTILDVLHSISVTTNATDSQLIEEYERDGGGERTFININLYDTRRLPMKGTIKISDIDDSNIIKVEFVKTKGDPLEWRRFFKRVTVASRDIVYVGN